MSKKTSDTPVFEGTIAGHKFLFRADKPELVRVAEVPAGKSAEEIALENSAELLARAKSNHEAVKELYKQWAAARRSAQAASPEAQAIAAEKAAKKAREKAEKAANRDLARAEKAKERAALKAAKLEEKAEALRKQAGKEKAKA